MKDLKLGGTTLQGHFFFKNGALSKNKKVTLCLLQILEGGTCTQCPLVPMSMLAEMCL